MPQNYEQPTINNFIVMTIQSNIYHVTNYDVVVSCIQLFSSKYNKFKHNSSLWKDFIMIAFKGSSKASKDLSRK